MATEPKAKPKVKVPKTGAQPFIKKAVLRNPGIEINDLVEQVEKAGYTVARSSVLTLRATVLDTLKVMHLLKLTRIPSLDAKAPSKKAA